VRVLVVDDDGAIRDVLSRGLAAEGFIVDCADDGPSGLWRALDGGYCAIVLDLLLPGSSGYKVCEALRSEGVDTPILVLTAKSGDLDQVDLLDAGADDFLTKPVSITVLAARLRALVRRRASVSANEIVRGRLRYDLGTRRCTVAEREVELTAREEQVLRQLLLASGACVTRAELLERVWGHDAEVDPSIVDVYLRRVRSKLDPVIIDNVRGVGYRIAGR